MDVPTTESNLYKSKNSRPSNLVSGAFLASVAGMSILGGFGIALAMAKKRDPTFFAKGMLPTKEIPESGGELAMRALKWGTIYAVSGFSIFCFSVWKLLGVNDLQEFRLKVGNVLPAIPKKEPHGRTEFSSLRDLLSYIIEEDNKKK